MYKPSWPKELDDAGWLATYLVGGFGIVFGGLAIWWKDEKPSLGDWGDYLGGIFAAIGFIWLIVAHVNSQRRIEEGQKDLENQMAFTQEVVASLARLAMSAQLQDAAAMANMLPVFTTQGSNGTILSRSAAAVHPTSWHVQARNEGDGVTLIDVIPRTNGVHVSLEHPGPCPLNGTCRINYSAGSPIKALQKLKCYLRFK